MSAFHTQRPEDAPLWLCFQMTLLHVNHIFKVFQKKKKKEGKEPSRNSTPFYQAYGQHQARCTENSERIRRSHVRPGK